MKRRSRTGLRLRLRMTPPTPAPHVHAWVDVSTFDQRHQGPRVPFAFDYKLVGGHRIVITNKHIHYPGVWVATFHPLFDKRELGPDTMPVEDAQREAIKLSRAILSQMLAQLPSDATEPLTEDGL